MRNTSPQQSSDSSEPVSPKTVPLYTGTQETKAPPSSPAVDPTSVFNRVNFDSGRINVPISSANAPQVAPFDPIAAPQAAPHPAPQPYAPPTGAPIPTPMPADEADGLNVIQLQENPVQSMSEGTPPKKRKSSNRLLTIGIIACIIAIVILIASVLVIQFKPFGLFDDTWTVEPPAGSQVEHAFETAEIPDPDLSLYAFIDTENLTRTSLGSYEVGSVEYTGSGSSRQATCNATATATYQNDSVETMQPLNMSMTYDRNSNSWTSGTVRSGNLTVTPNAAPDAEAIAKGFPEILKDYDSNLATLYEDAEITHTEELTPQGGTMEFTLTKQQEGANAITCTANTDVTWTDGNGWTVRITSVNGDVGDSNPNASGENAPAQPDQPSNSDSGSSDSGSSQTVNTPSNVNPSTGSGITLQLICFSGELVEVPGVISFDSSGHILLKTDDTIQVVFDNRTYSTDYFEIVGNGNWTNGQHVVVIGAMSATGTTSQAPLVINTSY